MLIQTILLRIVFTIRFCAVHFPFIKYNFAFVFYLNSICTFPIKEGFLSLHVLLHAAFNVIRIRYDFQKRHSPVLLRFADLYFGRGAQISTDTLLMPTID
jgi:hypothetical protein